MDTINVPTLAAPTLLYALAPAGTTAAQIKQSTKGLLPSTKVQVKGAPAIVGYANYQDALTAALIAHVAKRHKVRSVLVEPDRIALVLDAETRVITANALSDMSVYVYAVEITANKRYQWSPHPELPSVWISRTQTPFKQVEHIKINHAFNGARVTLAALGRGIVNVRLDTTTQGYTHVVNEVHVA